MSVRIPQSRPYNDSTHDDLREREVRSSEKASDAAELSALTAKSGAKFQTAGVALAAVAALVAVVTSALTLQSLRQQAASDYQKGLDERLGVAISAVASQSPEGRISGLTLLQRNSFARIDLALQNKGDPRVREDAVGVYGAALDVFENYLRAPRFNVQNEAAGLGYGKPEFPAEREYALVRLRSMLTRVNDVQALAQLEVQQPDTPVTRQPGGPAVDLSRTQLYRTSWRELQFGQLTGRTLSGADLRGSLLGKADLTDTNLSGTFLQCSNLGGDVERDASDRVSLRGANLTNADLRGANLQNVDLSGATITNANFSGANLDGADFSNTTGWESVKTAGAFSTMQTRGHQFGPGAVGNFFDSYQACLNNPTYEVRPRR